LEFTASLPDRLALQGITRDQAGKFASVLGYRDIFSSGKVITGDSLKTVNVTSLSPDRDTFENKLRLDAVNNLPNKTAN